MILCPLFLVLPPALSKLCPTWVFLGNSLLFSSCSGLSEGFSTHNIASFTLWHFKESWFSFALELSCGAGAQHGSITPCLYDFPFEHIPGGSQDRNSHLFTKALNSTKGPTNTFEPFCSLWDSSLPDTERVGEIQHTRQKWHPATLLLLCSTSVEQPQGMFPLSLKAGRKLRHQPWISAMQRYFKPPLSLPGHATAWAQPAFLPAAVSLYLWNSAKK